MQWHRLLWLPVMILQNFPSSWFNLIITLLWSIYLLDIDHQFLIILINDFNSGTPLCVPSALWCLCLGWKYTFYTLYHFIMLKTPDSIALVLVISTLERKLGESTWAFQLQSILLNIFFPILYQINPSAYQDSFINWRCQHLVNSYSSRNFRTASGQIYFQEFYFISLSSPTSGGFAAVTPICNTFSLKLSQKFHSG